MRFEYDLSPRLYSFVSGDAEHDEVQQLTIRAIPKAGIGYKVWEKRIDEIKVNSLQIEAGGAGPGFMRNSLVERQTTSFQLLLVRLRTITCLMMQGLIFVWITCLLSMTGLTTTSFGAKPLSACH